ncbi:beta-lactamase family containing protein [Rhizoctonia solani AG-3 Rhs1AP]|uniref:Beta-lactamase family containing protein n=2 Tax=Rhizoctonia solani AG-3 TaxID=1086053 RepID=A0A074SAZ2_9AGAM|nr:beta-lactamase family containing protein [Rhizoctonia solani AG-3 Rhs1AP]KEP54745.1 beta-lactamase family containing protein [Rhizoctonia solani 123E]
MTTNSVNILILGAGWLSHFLLPILHESNLSHASTSRTGSTPNTIRWNLGDGIEVLPKADTIVVMFPVDNWEDLKSLIEGYQKSNGDSLWMLIGSTRAWQGTDAQSDSVITRHTPLPPNAPARSLVEEQFLKAYPTRAVVLNLVGLHGRPPVPGDTPHGAPRLVPNFIKRIGPTKDSLKQKASVHFVHGSDAALAIVLVHQGAQKMVGRWIVSDCLVRDWWAIALELGGQQEKQWALELTKEEQVAALPRQKGLGRIMDGSDFWVATESVPGYVGLTV